MLISKIEAILQFIKEKRILLLTHNAVDIDALASCFSLREFLSHFHTKSDIQICFTDISKSTFDFIKKFKDKFLEFNHSYDQKADLSNFDVIIILDTNNLQQVDILANSAFKDLPLIYIDHHTFSKDLSQDPYSIIIPEYSSTSEIILEFFETKQLIPSLAVKFLFLAGILVDSGFFKHGTNDTLIHASTLLNKDIKYHEVLSFLRRERDLSERIALIKGLQRVKLIKGKDWLIGISHVGSYEAEVASILVKNGFDIGIVLSEKKEEFRISSRANKIFCTQTGVNLGKIIEEVSKKYHAHGGGHDGAASINGTHNQQEILNEIVEEIKQILNQIR